MLGMTRAVARQSAVPVEHARPQRLAANAEDWGELGVRGLRRMAIHWPQISAQENVAIRCTIREFLRCVRARSDLYR